MVPANIMFVNLAPLIDELQVMHALDQLVGIERDYAQEIRDALPEGYTLIEMHDEPFGCVILAERCEYLVIAGPRAVRIWRREISVH